MRQNYNNYPIAKQTGLPSGSTFLLDAFNQMHAIIWFYCFIIIGVLIILFMNILLQQRSQWKEIHDMMLEGNFVKWNVTNRSSPYIVYDNWLVELTILLLPFLIIVLICVPSTALSYSTGEIHNVVASVKVVGHQWYWENEVCIPITANKPIDQWSLIFSKQFITILKLYKANKQEWSWTGLKSETKFLINKEKIDPACEKVIKQLRECAKQTKIETELLIKKGNSNCEKFIDQFRECAKAESQRLLKNNNNLLWFKKATEGVCLTNFETIYWNISTKNYYLYHTLLQLQKGNHVQWINFTFKQAPILTEHLFQCASSATPIPGLAWTKLTVEASDVIHSYWVWDFGLKLDCIPGNPLQTFIFPKKFGISIGSCAEYCGKGHTRMPIVLKVYNFKAMSWYKVIPTKSFFIRVYYFYKKFLL